MADKENWTMQCLICGKTVKRMSPHQKYCPDCSKMQNDLSRIKSALQQKRLREAKKEQIEICLTCTRKRCTGLCKKFKY